MYNSIVPMLYRKADVFVLVCDITNRRSFEGLTKWLNDIEEYREDAATNSTKIMVIGNKADLEEARAVTCQEGKTFAMEKQMSFFETSAKTGANVNEAFEYLVNQLEEETKVHDNYKSYVQSLQVSSSTRVRNTRRPRCLRCSSSTSTQSYEALHDERQRSHPSASITQCQSYAAGDNEIDGNHSKTPSKCIYTHVTVNTLIIRHKKIITNLFGEL